MPRLDAARLGAWRELHAVVNDVARRIDDELRAEWAVPLASFEVPRGPTAPIAVTRYA